MARVLDFSHPPEYLASSYRAFYPGEKHVTRVCQDDVLVLVFSGTLRFTEGGLPIEVPAGRYYIQEAGLFQQGLTSSGTPEYFYIHFHGHFSGSCAEGLSRAGSYSYPTLRPLFDRLDALERESGSPVRRTAVFYTILSELYAERSPREPTAAREIEVYLSENFTADISLDDIADRLHYSKDHIIRAFRARYGVTPYKYVTRLRMEHARQLLISTGRSVSRIAADCGYEDESSFYRAFRAESGVTPAQWRAGQWLELGGRPRGIL